MHNKQVTEAVSEEDENMWFLNLSKCMLMHCVPHGHKVTTLPTTTGHTVPSVPVIQSDSNKAKLEVA